MPTSSRDPPPGDPALQPVPPRPRIHRRYRVEVLGSEGAVLLSERGYRWLEGDLYARLLPLIDGRSSPANLVESLQGHAAPAEVFAALVVLGRAGLLEDAASPDSAAPVVAELPGGAGAALTEAADSRRVAVFSGVAGLRQRLISLLRDRGLAEGEEGADLAVVLTDDYLSPELADLDRRFRSLGRPWLLVRPRGEKPQIGPLFRPPEPPCWQCLAACLRPNRAVESYLARRRAGATAPRAPLPATEASVDYVLALALDRALAHLAGADSGLAARLLSVDLASGEVSEHRVGGPPDCRRCGRAAPRPAGPAAVHLAPRPKRATRDGGHRALLPEETLAKIEPALSPITGIVHALERRHVAPEGRRRGVAPEGRRRGVAPEGRRRGKRAGAGAGSVYSAAHAIPRHYSSWQTLHRRLRARCFGKGIGEIQARVSAAAEAIERYAGIFRGDEPRQRAAFRDLGEGAIHPNACMLFSDRQYADRERRSRDGGGSRVPPGQRNTAPEGDKWGAPAPFDPDRAIDWTPLWSLTERRFKLLPTAYCYYDVEEPAGSPSCLADSNGNAAGNTVEEAVLQGFLELVERDAAALWWYSRARRPRIDLEAFEQPFFDRLAGFFESLGRELWALDLTSDFGIPAAVAVSRPAARRAASDSRGGDLMMGFGAHPAPEIAVGRALSELCQFLPRRPGGRAAVSPRWLRLGATDPAWLEPRPEAPPRAPASWDRWPGDDLAQDVRTCVRLARKKGLEVLVLDQTRWDTPLTVVKVVVPGLRPWWPRFAPGRLYDVPADLGWVTEPLCEDRLNPDHLFL